MKRVKLFISMLVLLVVAGSAMAQKTYTYKTYPNDPMQVREYTLDNGLKVFMSVYKNAPKVQTYIAVKAGSKNDPAETTGLAHYLEHMMFKGTPTLGTKDWEKEKVYIQKLEDLFEAYRMFTDQTTRTAIYHMIDSLSYEASKLAIANEYDKAMSAIGSTGTNAFTSNDYTMYVENIPNNQIETWCEIQADRFQNMVLRLFHTELETIYEEKNMSLTKDGRRANEEMFAALFPHHPYGTQTTLGTVEHLKNPSMRNIRNFVKKYYVPNNMCISMAGDFNPDEAIQIIDKYFGSIPSQPVPEFTYTKEQPITSVITKNITGLDQANTQRAYRIDSGNGSHDAMLASLLCNVLYNGNCGLIDLNINQSQRCMFAYASPYILNDYGSFIFAGYPNEGQSLEDVQELLAEQVALVKQGEFEDWILEAAINNMKLDLMKEVESNNNRASKMAYAFVENRNWGEVINEVDELSKITKQELVEFANRIFKDNNYVIVNKLQGNPPEVAKVTKPAITPIEVSREDESAFLKDIKARQVKKIEPVFVDYDKDMQKGKMKNGAEVLYVKNVENATFNLDYRFEFGDRADKSFDLASSVLDYLNTDKHTAEQLQQEFYKLACTYHMSVGDEEMTIGIRGLSENMEKAMALVEEIFSSVQPNEEALKIVVSQTLKNRIDSKTNQQAAFGALTNYGVYGEDSPTKDVMSKEEMEAYTCQQLCDVLKNMFNYKHMILYYGPESFESVKGIIEKDHKMPKKFVKSPVNKKIEPKAVTENTVLFVDYDAAQTYLYEYNRGAKYNTKMEPQVMVYNEYFGGSMNAIVFQELREKRSLAYTAQSAYYRPSKKDSYYTNGSFIASQNDKVIDALTAFEELFDEMPVAEANFKLAQESVQTKIRTNRTTKRGIMYSYLNSKKMGYKENPNIKNLEVIPTMTMQDIVDFNHKYIKGQHKTYMVLGRESDMDFNALAKFGKIKKLTLEDIFGY